MMAKSMTMFEIVNDVPGHAFDPCGLQTSNLREAQRELNRVRLLHPAAYIARVDYSRVQPKAKKNA